MIYAHLKVFLLFDLLYSSLGTIYFFNHDHNFTFSLEDSPSLFGPSINNQLEGYLSLTQPLDACEPTISPKGTSRYIGLSSRGNCSFTQKVLNSQNNYIGLIVFDNIDEGLIPMDGDSDKIMIPSVMISLSSKKMIVDYNAIGNYTLIKPGGSNYLLLYLIPFTLFLFLILIGLIAFLIYRIVLNYRASRKLALSRSQLRKLKKLTFKKGNCNYETCAICIDDYANGDKLRVLPCNHAYHCKCIDKWLLKRRRVCPICKHVIRFPGESIDSDIERDSSARPNTETENATSQSARAGDEPHVSIILPRRRKRRHQQLDPSNQQQASTSVGNRLDAPRDDSTDSTNPDSDFEGHLQSSNSPKSILDRVASRLKSTFSGENSNPEVTAQAPRRFVRRKRVTEDRAPLVHASESSAPTSGHSTPALQRSSPLTSNSNLGFAQDSIDKINAPKETVKQPDEPSMEEPEVHKEEMQ